MADTDPLDSAGSEYSPTARQVMEALRSGGGGISSLRPLLQEGSLLSPEQRDVLDILELFDELDESPAAEAEGPRDEQDSAELASLRAEVVDLREVNDAAAAALGACRVCWGGDEICPVCAGRGRPGANLPDLRLYSELVQPAVERITAAGVTPPRSVGFPDEEAPQ
jgi:hypothetical protein